MKIYSAFCSGRRKALREKTRQILGFLLVLSLAFPATVLSEFLLSDPQSRVYYTLAVTAGDRIQVVGETEIVGDVYSNGDVDLMQGSRVSGDATAAGQVTGQGTVAGDTAAGAAAIDLPALLDADAFAELADRVFDGDTTLTDAVIDDVVLVRGTLRIRGDLNGTGTLIATRDIRVDTTNNDPPFVLDEDTRLSLIAFDDIRIGKDRPLRGALRAGRDVLAEKDFDLEGVIVADRKVQLAKDSRVTLVDVDPAPPEIVLTPADGSVVSTPRPAIGATIRDDVSGVDPTTFQIALDGVDRTGDAILTPDSVELVLAEDLAEGTHVVSVAAADHSRKLIRVSGRFLFDTTPGTDETAPTIVFTAPANPALRDERAPRVTFEFGDAQSGVDPATVRLRLEGDDVTGLCDVTGGSASCQLPLLNGAVNGFSEHLLTAELSDLAGNPASAELTLYLILGEGDLEAPQVSVTSPSEGSLVTDPLLVVRGIAADDGVVQRVLVHGVDATIAGDQFEAQVPLPEGPSTLAVRATDGSGRQGTTTLSVIVDTAPPLLEVLSPLPGGSTHSAVAVVRGTVVDENGVDGVEVNGEAATLSGNVFEASVALAEGANAVTVRAVDAAGNSVSESFDLSLFTLPEVAVTAPAPLTVTGDAEVEVLGTVSESVTAVTVNGVDAPVTAGTFAAPVVPLLPGANLLTAVAVDSNGHVGTSTVTVMRDSDPPQLRINAPLDGAVVRASPVSVRGLARELGAGSLGAEPLAVTVNGATAAVANGTFFLDELVLLPGENVIAATATDGAGNVAETSVTVRFDPPSGRRLRLVSGNHQAAAIGSLLPEPLVVELLDDAGEPEPGQDVLFQVRTNNGSLTAAGVDSHRLIAVTTDAQGLAAARFTLGTRAGAGNQEVEASVVGIPTPVAFNASALPGTPALVTVDSGDQQVGVAGQPLPRPLVIVVTDDGSNRLTGVPVRFQVVQGSATFKNGFDEIEVLTNDGGRASAEMVLGAEEGIANNIAEVTVPGLADSPVASFVASALVAGDPADTSVSGIVLDNTSLPVPGVTLRLEGTGLSALADSAGTFTIPGAPVGPVELVVDGGTALRPGVWPQLRFELTTIPGRDNTVGMPIYLLPLDVGRGLAVSETEGGVLTLPELAGFSLEIAPGSVTFPDGGRSGVVSVTPVHSDKVPMVPNFGQQPRFVITIQPAGAIFDPPARLTLPNVDGLAPGEVTELYSFDHDLGSFVSIGPGTVSDDGLLVVSDPGVGVVKAGWHCGGNPASSGTTHDCPICQDCVNNRCEPDDGQTPPQNAPDDCQKEECQGGGVVSMPDTGETPPDVAGNCAEELCSDSGPDERADLGDPPAGQDCCGNQGDPGAAQAFDPGTQCCVDNNQSVVPKHPIQDLDQCPNRTDYPPFQQGSNGCGSASFNVPENPNVLCFGPSFTPACDTHDFCYGDCNQDKGFCDAQFRDDMLAICGSSNIFCRLTCIENALIYFAGVAGGGGSAYEGAQSQACQCCP